MEIKFNFQAMSTIYRTKVTKSIKAKLGQESLL